MTSKPQFWSGAKRTTFIVIALLMALGYVIAAAITDSGRLVAALHDLGWWGGAAILALSLMNYFLRFQRWKRFISKLGHRIPVWRHFLYYLSGFAFTISPAKAGEAVRSLYLKDHGVTYAESIAAFFVERLLDLFAMVMLAGLILIDHPAYRVLVFASFAAVIVIIAVVSQASLPLRIERLGGSGAGRVARGSMALASLLRSSRRLLHPRSLLLGAALGLLAWGAEGVGFGIVCQSLHISGDLWSFCGIYAIAVLAGSAAFFLPAGIGGMEVVMTTLLVERGTELRVAIIATLLCRLATLWFAVILGVGAASTVEFADHNVPVQPLP